MSLSLWVYLRRQPRLILAELARHAPFTALGAVLGIAIMVIMLLSAAPASVSYTVFYTLHPLHVLLSAIVTTAMYRLYGGRGSGAFVIGWSGSVGIATVSDMVLPYLGGLLVGAEMEFHIGFIEKWWLVNPVAFAGIALGYWRPTTRLPHSGHVLLSTWASLFYLTAFGVADWFPLLPFVFLILLVAVWFPCCLSDIVFPLLFVKNGPPRHGHRH